MTSVIRSTSPNLTPERPWLEETLEAKAALPDLDARIDAYQRAAPFPPKQFERTERRAWLAQRLPRHAIGAEIGVFRGHKTLKTQDAYDEAKLRALRGGATGVVMVQGYFPACRDAVRHRLDWAYLDASHNYEDTVAELEALDQMVDPDGVIAGDDWTPDPAIRHHGVFRPVQEFTQRTSWKIVMCGYLGQWMLRRC